MPIVLSCPTCGARVKAPDGSASKRWKCPRCGTAENASPPSKPASRSSAPADGGPPRRAPEPILDVQPADIPVVRPVVASRRPADRDEEDVPRSRRRRPAGDGVGFRCPFCGADEPPLREHRLQPIGLWLCLTAVLSCVGVLLAWLPLIIFREETRVCRRCGIKLGG